MFIFLFLLLFPLIAQAGEGISGGSASGGTVRHSHATDCSTGVTTALSFEQCVDLDDGKLWTCSSPSAGGASSTLCDDAGDWILNSSASSSGVSTFETRAGAVVSVAGDYTATEITNTPAGDIAATTAQAALNELDTEKLPLAGGTATGNVLLDDNTGDSPQVQFAPQDGTQWNLYVENTGDDFQLEANTASTETIDIGNVGAGVVNVTVDGSVTATGGFVGNSSTSSALAANPSGCDSTSLLRDVTAAGAAETCIDVGTNDGTPNEGSDPVSWAKLANVPTGFADGVDDDGASFTDETDCRTNVTTATLGQTCRELDDALTWSCDDPAAGGVSSTVCDDSGDWGAISATATTPTQQQVYDASGATPAIDVSTDGMSFVDLTSLAKAVRFCEDAARTSCANFYWDATNGFTIEIDPPENQTFNVANNQALIFQLDGTEWGRLDEATGKFQLAALGQLLRSVEVTGREFGSCSYAESALVAGRPIAGYFTCTDSDSDGMDFDFLSPLNYNASTLTIRACAASVNATPANNLVLSCSGQAVSDGDVVAARATTGEQTITLTFSGQYKEECATSAAITITGTPAAGDHLYMHCDIDATGTTATIADIRINSTFKVFYSINNLSE